MATTNCPVYRPTEDEFKCFESYIARIDRERGDCGIVKVIPPNGWYKCDLTKLYDSATSMKTAYPVRQAVSGLPGVFTVTHFEIKALTLNDFIAIDTENCYKDANFEEREYKFWKSLGKASPWSDPIYGADVPGSLFNDSPVSESAWNLDKLDSMLRDLPHTIPGVSRAMLYIGSWRAMFAFHVEDYNLYSINFLHTGAEKSWYSIPLNYKQRFENMAQAYFMEDYNECREFLRHKTKMISPKKLKENGIAFNTVVQHEGEFVITFPGSYHAGFNHGLNIAEATNFAFPQWLPSGRAAKRCVCRPNAVTIDVECLEAKYLRKTYSNCSINHESCNTQPLINLESVHDAVRIRCICNKVETSSTSNDELVTCKSCRLKYHKICVENATKQYAVCHICYALDNGIEIPVCFNPQNNWQSFSNNTRNLTVSKRKRVVKKRRPNQILIGDYVQTNLNNTATIVEGVISAVEDGLGRLHIKGMKREQDIWVSLEDCSLIVNNHIAPENAHNNCSNTAKAIIAEKGSAFEFDGTNALHDTIKLDDYPINTSNAETGIIRGIQSHAKNLNDSMRSKVQENFLSIVNVSELKDFDFLSIHPDLFFESQKILLTEDLKIIDTENFHEEYILWMKQALIDITEIEIDGSEVTGQYFQNVLAEGLVKCKFKNTRGFLSVLCLYAQSKKFNSIRKLVKKYLSLLTYNLSK